MSEWKIMLPYQGKPIINHVMEAALSTADQVILVTGHRGEELCRHFAGTPGISFLQNTNYSRGMFSSIRTGAAGLADLETGLFFILHADLPLISTSHITDLLCYFTHQQKNRSEIVQPLCGTVPGHPVILSGSVRKSLMKASDYDSMRDIYKNHTVSYYQTDDPAYITDIDTAESYNTLINRSNMISGS